VGGRGSGYRRRPLKQTVEECLWLDINLLRTRGITDKAAAQVFFTASAGLTKKEVASVGYVLSDEDGNAPVVTFNYGVKGRSGKKVVKEPVRLQTTRTRLGQAVGTKCLDQVPPPGGRGVPPQVGRAPGSEIA
jgi:hypothetical protein